MPFEETDDEQVQDKDYPKPFLFCLSQKSKPGDHKIEILICPWANPVLAYVAYLLSARVKNQGFMGLSVVRSIVRFLRKSIFIKLN